MQLILVAPGLLAQSPETLAAAPSLAALARFAATPKVEPQGVAAAVVGALGLPASAAIAPLMALGAGIDPGDDYLIAADPVFLAADRGDVVLVQRVDDLAPEEATALLATLNRHFEGDELRFVVARADAWFARCARSPDIATAPIDVVLGRGLYPHLPSGVDAGTWRGWQNEIQMLLHEHPINADRQAQGKVPATGVWFWGGGTLPGVGSLPAVATTAAAGRIGDLARGIARRGRGADVVLAPDDTTSLVTARVAAHSGHGDPPATALVVCDGVDDVTGFSAFETRWLASALTMLARREISALHVVTDGNGIAARWTASRPSFRQRILARARPKRFTVPLPSEA